jgi:dimethylhistidine N-methyltransferase
MNPAASPAVAVQIDDAVAEAVRCGLASRQKSLPPWLFYDEAGSRLFDAITELPEYYLTRTERGILAANAPAIMTQAAGGAKLRIAELGAGSADKTRILLNAAVALQRAVVYEPIDVSPTALESAHKRIQREIPQVHVAPRVEDYTRALEFDPAGTGERRLVLYIGSSIGNFEMPQAQLLLARIREALNPGDSLLLGVDLVKEESILLAAYNDAAKVTAAFNRNLLVRLNRELGGDFRPKAFAHRARWNASESRIEMHLESLYAQRVRLSAMDLEARFASGETIHTENSYKFAPGQAESMLAEAGFIPAATWTDDRNWFAVHLARAE